MQKNSLGWKGDLFVSGNEIYAVWVEGKNFYSIAFAKSENKVCLPFWDHLWDKEHVSARLVYSHNVANCSPNWHPSDESNYIWNANSWRADLWKFFAHEGTLCQKINYKYGSYSSGIDVFVSKKHGTFPSQQKCNNNLAICFDSYNLLLPGKCPIPINIGQLYHPLNNQWWAQCGGFLFEKMDPDVTYEGCGTINRCPD